MGFEVLETRIGFVATFILLEREGGGEREKERESVINILHVSKHVPQFVHTSKLVIKKQCPNLCDNLYSFHECIKYLSFYSSYKTNCTL